MQIQPGLIPRYYQLKEILVSRIESGEFQVGNKFPTDEELCAEYQLSRGTVRRALDMLVEEGKLRREQGRGTFVNSPVLSPVYFRLANFEEEMRSRAGNQAQAIDLEIPCQRRNRQALADPYWGGCDRDFQLRLADDKPMAYETRYLSYKTCHNCWKKISKTSQSILAYR
jgi:GntR family transcriptional regulator